MGHWKSLFHGLAGDADTRSSKASRGDPGFLGSDLGGFVKQGEDLWGESQHDLEGIFRNGGFAEAHAHTEN